MHSASSYPPSATPQEPPEPAGCGTKRPVKAQKRNFLPQRIGHCFERKGGVLGPDGEEAPFVILEAFDRAAGPAPGLRTGAAGRGGFATA